MSLYSIFIQTPFTFLAVTVDAIFPPKFNTKFEPAREFLTGQTIRPCGPTDKASDYESGDCRFESCQGQNFDKLNF